MSKLDQVELGLGLALGVGALYAIYRVTKATGSMAQEQIDRATAALDVATNSSLQAGWNEWKNPACAPDDPDPLCTKRQPGPHDVVDEQGNPVGTIDWSKVNK